VFLFDVFALERVRRFLPDVISDLPKGAYTSGKVDVSQSQLFALPQCYFSERVKIISISFHGKVDGQRIIRKPPTIFCEVEMILV
jgi:hypothetical protein